MTTRRTGAARGRRRPSFDLLDQRRLPAAFVPGPEPTVVEAASRPGHVHAVRLAGGALQVDPTGGFGMARPGVGHAAMGRMIADIPYTHHGKDAVKLDLYLPDGPPPPGGWPIVLAFPGGGWRQADRKDYGAAASILTQHGYAVAGVDYTYARPSGGPPAWPTDFQDAQEAVRWARHNAARFGLDPGRIAAMGESAGAHLALLLGTDADGPAAPGIPSARVQAVVDFYGPTDLATLYAQSRPEVLPYFHTFLGGPPSEFPSRYADASPLAHVSSETPPVLILQGLADRTVFPSQSLALDAALTAAGVSHRLIALTGITHGFRFTMGPYDLLPDVVAFLDDALKAPADAVARV